MSARDRSNIRLPTITITFGWHFSTSPLTNACGYLPVCLTATFSAIRPVIKAVPRLKLPCGDCFMSGAFLAPWELPSNLFGRTGRFTRNKIRSGQAPRDRGWGVSGELGVWGDGINNKLNSTPKLDCPTATLPLLGGVRGGSFKGMFLTIRRNVTDAVTRRVR